MNEVVSGPAKGSTTEIKLEPSWERFAVGTVEKPGAEEGS